MTKDMICRITDEYPRHPADWRPGEEEAHKQWLKDQIEEKWTEMLTPDLIAEALTEGVVCPDQFRLAQDGITRQRLQSRYEDQVHYPVIAALVQEEDWLSIGEILGRQIKAYAMKLAEQELHQ